MKKIILLNKKEGETPFLALQNFRAKYKAYKDAKITYVGRLDPLVSGLLLLLVGDKIKEKETYQGLSKEYKFEILFGFTTDTHDILGKVTQMASLDLVVNSKSELQKKIKQNLKFFTGKFQQKYPMYSSKTVLGKALFTYARRGVKIKQPEHEVEIKSLEFLKLKKINARKFLENIERRIKKVKGDFRQKEILKIWRDQLEKSKESFLVASFYVKCGPGMYVRSVANDLGEKLKIPALAFSIKRTKIGQWSKIA